MSLRGDAHFAWSAAAREFVIARSPHVEQHVSSETFSSVQSASDRHVSSIATAGLVGSALAEAELGAMDIADARVVGVGVGAVVVGSLVERVAGSWPLAHPTSMSAKRSPR